MSRRLNILCIIFKIIAIFLIELLTRLAFYLRGKNLHSHIISLREEVWAHITCIASPLFIDVHIPSQECGRSSMCVRSINFVFIYALIFDFGIVCFSFYSILYIYYRTIYNTFTAGYMITVLSVRWHSAIQTILSV